MARNSHDKVLAMIEQPVDIQRLVRKLAFSEDEIENAALRQPGLQLEVGRLRAQLYMRKASLRRRLARVRAKKGLKIRHRESGLTETAIKSQLDLDPDVERMQKKFDIAEAMDVAIDDLREAYKERNMVLGFLVKLRASEMDSEIRHAKTGEALDKLSKRASKARKKFRDL